MNLTDPAWIDSVVQQLGWTIVHSLWEGLAVGTGVWIALIAARRSSARVRCGAACGGMMVLVSLLIATFWMMRPTVATAGSGMARSVVLPTMRSQPAMSIKPMIGGVKALTWRQSIGGRLNEIVITWIVGISIMGIWRLGGWIAVERLRRTHVRAIEARWESLALHLASRLGIGLAVRVLESGLAAVPGVVGVWRPVVLMPVGMMCEMSLGQVEAILAHELAHVRRNDYLINLIQTCIETALFYHPAVWWMSKRIRQEREHCCDELAVETIGGDRVTYARALTYVEERRQGMTGGGQLTTAANGGDLMERIARLFQDKSRISGKSSSQMIGAIAALTIVVAIVVAYSWNAHRVAGLKRSIASTQPLIDGGIHPEDLAFEMKDYAISPGDTVEVSISDLQGPAKETVKVAKVSESGSISLPYIKTIQLAGLAEADAEQRIAEKYRTGGLIRDAIVSVRVTDARGNTFTVVGGVGKPGQYTIGKPGLRLVEAIALAGGADEPSTIRILRGKGAQQRVIEVSMRSVLAGERAANIIVRPDDVITASQGEPERAMILGLGVEA